ncbi:hypothetical protein AVEN_19081-1 [Araneus ventricosus]|uniref:Uncharacterized protein n=1 Tax=Araneus ventricosus TaxID=182803 RepID=A0A4Y2U614_ARAVE|nr:hypothetical protein AVEN_19081-1 [Araneus ventricosus]
MNHGNSSSYHRNYEKSSHCGSAFIVARSSRSFRRGSQLRHSTPGATAESMRCPGKSRSRRGGGHLRIDPCFNFFFPGHRHLSSLTGACGDGTCSGDLPGGAFWGQLLPTCFPLSPATCSPVTSRRDYWLSEAALETRWGDFFWCCCSPT